MGHEHDIHSDEQDTAVDDVIGAQAIDDDETPPPSRLPSPIADAEPAQNRQKLIRVGALAGVGIALLVMVGLYSAEMLGTASGNSTPDTIEPFLTWDELGTGETRVSAPRLRSNAFRQSQPEIVIDSFATPKVVPPIAPPDTSAVERACATMVLSSVVSGAKPMALLDGKIVRVGDNVKAGDTGIRLRVNAIASDHLLLAWSGTRTFRIELKR